MAAPQRSQPALYSAPRRFGRYEPFRRFDHLSSGHASVGSKCLGKMTVDCRFLFKKSRWGVLGESQFPAGIIYLDLNFGPPQGCKLKSATVTVTLDDAEECLRTYQSRNSYSYHRSGCPVQMTDWYGPKQLVGEDRSAEYKRTIHMTPEVSAMEVGVGGLGLETEKNFKCSSRWTFNGQLLPGKDTWTYKTLRWGLTDNELESQAFRSSLVHTAFAFEHCGQPFLMKVEIEGKLEKWNHRVKSKLKFGSSINKDGGQTTTLINFGKWDTFKNPLDDLARSLPRAMELENYEATPVKLPDSIEGSFHPTTPDLRSSEDNQSTIQQVSSPHQVPLNNIASPPSLAVPKAAQSLDATEPTLENIKQVLEYLSRPPEANPYDSPRQSVSSSSNTVVAEEDIHEQAKTVQYEKKGELVSFFNPQPDQEAILRLLQIPTILTLLQLLSSLIDMFGALRKKVKQR